jgi:hypothetical protein
MNKKPLGTVEGRPVYPGDKLYVDIRNTCATEWGDGQIASMGANEGQGAMIIFEDGDYRMCDRLVWEPKPLPVPEPTAKAPEAPPFVLQAYQNPANYSKEELMKILTAFFDIADGIQEHEFVEHTGDSCLASQVNYGEARKLVCDKRWGR